MIHRNHPVMSKIKVHTQRFPRNPLTQHNTSNHSHSQSYVIMSHHLPQLPLFAYQQIFMAHQEQFSSTVVRVGILSAPHSQHKINKTQTHTYRKHQSLISSLSQMVQNTQRTKCSHQHLSHMAHTRLKKI